LLPKQNWGLITFRQTALLYDPQQSSASDKQRVAIVIAHELAHQWFGNLVTMEVRPHAFALFQSQTLQ
jgi:aminopeptidase N